MIADLLKKMPSADAEGEILERLKGLSSADRERTVMDMLNSDNIEVRIYALRLTRRFIKGKDLLLSAFDCGLARRSIEEIRHWIIYIGPNLGWKPLVRHLSSIAESKAEELAIAWYWLSRLIPEQYPDSIPELRQIRSILEQKSPSFEGLAAAAWASVR